MSLSAMESPGNSAFEVPTSSSLLLLRLWAMPSQESAVDYRETLSHPQVSRSREHLGGNPICSKQACAHSLLFPEVGYISPCTVPMRHLVSQVPCR